MAVAKTARRGAKKPPAAAMPIRQAVLIYRRHGGFFLRLGLLASLVHLGLGLLGSPGSISLDQELWFVIMLGIYMAFADTLGRAGGGARSSLRTAFYEGSRSFLKQFLVIAVWVAYLVPFLIGGVIAFQVNLQQFGASSVELWVINGVWLGLAGLSLYWIVRAIFAPLYALSEWPIAAIHRSWRATRGRTVWIGGRLLGVLLGLSLPLVALYFVVASYFSELDAIVTGFTVLLTLLQFGLVFPLLALLIYQLSAYESPKRRSPAH